MGNFDHFAYGNLDHFAYGNFVHFAFGNLDHFAYGNFDHFAFGNKVHVLTPEPLTSVSDGSQEMSGGCQKVFFLATVF